MGREITLEYNIITMNDHSIFNYTRQEPFVNIRRYRALDDMTTFYQFKDTPERRIIKMYNVAVGKEGKRYYRYRNNFIDEIATLGGLLRGLGITLAVTYIVFAQPGIDLDLGIAY